MKNNLSVICILVCGFMLTFGRELLFTFYLGIGIDGDIFRAAFSIPNFFIQAVSTAMISANIGYLSKLDKHNYYVMTTNTIVFISIVTILGMLTSKLQSTVFYPGLKDHQDILTNYIALHWAVYFFSGIILPIRSIYTYNQNKVLASLYNPLRNFLIVAITILLVLLSVRYMSKLDVLTYTMIYSSIFLSVVYICIFVKEYLTTNWLAIIIKTFRENLLPTYYLKFISKNYLILLTSTLLFQLLISSNRFVDRYYASYLGDGYLSVVEISYGVMAAIGGLLLTTANILILPNIIKKTISQQLVKKLYIIGLIVASIIYLIIFLTPEFIVTLLSWIFLHGNISESDISLIGEIFRYQASVILYVFFASVLAHYCISQGWIAKLILIIIFKLIIKVSLLVYFIDYLGLSALGISYMVSEIFFLLGITVFVKIKVENQSC